MSTITDSDLQQLKDLITAGQLATQQQIAELALSTQQQIAELKGDIREAKAELAGDIREVKAELGGKIDTINAELTIIKSNQKAQDARFWTLIFLIITTSIGVIGKLAKFY
jgi:hypothetical protein